MNLDDLLAAGEPGRPALLVPGGLALDYATMRATSRAIGAALAAAGIAPGERVAASFGNGPEVIAAFFGTAGARATFAPLNSAYTEEEFRFYLEDIGPRAILLAPGAVPAARAAATTLSIPIVDLALDASGAPLVDGALASGTHERTAQDGDVALFLHTSGTTSRPKGVPLTHGNLTTSAHNMVRWYKLTNEDVSYCVMPLFHVHGLVFSTLATLAAGGSVVVPERFSASAFWPAVAAMRATIVSAVPTIYRTLLLRAEDDAAPGPGEHGLRFMRSSSAPLPASEMERLEARFGVPVIEGYSMTERPIRCVRTLSRANAARARSASAPSSPWASSTSTASCNHRTPSARWRCAART